MPPDPGLAALFAGFLSVGVVGFGGVLPWIRRMVVDQRGWLDATEFTDTLALGQLLPGPNVTNLAIIVGTRYRGAAGAVAAVGGLIAAPMAIILCLGSLLQRFGGLAWVAHAVAGVGCAGAGLVLATAARIAAPLIRRSRARRLGVGVAVLVFLAVAGLRLPLLLVLVVAVPVSIALHARAWRPDA